MKTRSILPRCYFFALLITLGVLSQAPAQVIISSVTPARGAIGVSPSAAVVFTFSAPMDQAATTAGFFDTVNPVNTPTFTQVWSGGDTVLTCTPSPAFTAGHGITWFVSGTSAIGDDLFDTGTFTIAGSAGTGSGTNKITTFSVGKIYSFDQGSSAAPVLDSLAPYGFSATTSLASNRTATSVTLTLPNNAVSNLTQNPLHSESFFLFATFTDQTAFNTTFPTGNYQFSVLSTTNQNVTVNLPASLTQPNAPHISNFAPAQTVNPTQPFTLNWDAFSGGTASDFIFVDVGEVFLTSQPGTPGALSGTATSVLIPAGTLAANSNYDCSIGFYHALTSSNSSYATLAFVASVTRFTLTTAPGASSTLLLTNASWTPANFSFEVSCTPGQAIVVESSATLQPGSWSGILSTNPSGNRVRVIDPRAATNRSLLYRARKGP